MGNLTDQYGRVINYMRVSITDRCNLRCRYCMPDGITCIPMEEILTLEETAQVCRQAAALGISRIKVTGGEPLVRLGCIELIRMLKAVPGIAQVTLTTNGVLLEKYADALCEAGISAVNVSLDTLDAAEYREITGFDAFESVMRGISAVSAHRIPVKINSVLHKEQEEAYVKLAELAKDRPVSVRFIEMMPIGYGRNYKPVSNKAIFQGLEEHFGALTADETVHGNGPAVYYKIPGFWGSIGFISAIHGKFCGSCNRIRLTPAGQLKPCLCYGDGISIKEAVRGGQWQEVRSLIAEAVMKKPAGHAFDDRAAVTEHREMARIGG